MNKVDIKDLISMYYLFKSAILCDEPNCQDAIDILNKYGLTVDEELYINEDIDER